MQKKVGEAAKGHKSSRQASTLDMFESVATFFTRCIFEPLCRNLPLFRLYIVLLPPFRSGDFQILYSVAMFGQRMSAFDD